MVCSHVMHSKYVLLSNYNKVLVLSNYYSILNWQLAHSQNSYFFFEHTLKRSNTSTAMMIVPADQMTLRRSRRKRRRKCPDQPVTDVIFDLDATESAWVEDALDSGTPTSMPVINSQPETMNFQTKVRIHQYNLGEVFYHFIREAFYFCKKFLVDIF